LGKVEKVILEKQRSTAARREFGRGSQTQRKENLFQRRVGKIQPVRKVG